MASSAPTTRKKGSRNISGTRRAGCSSTITLKPACARPTNTLRLSILCGRAWRPRNRPRNWSRNLGIFEQPGGLAMSSTDASVQWDYPYGWAPTQIVAIEGLAAIRLQRRCQSHFLQFPVHHRGELSPRRHDPREIQRGDSFLGVGRPRGISAERDRLRLDQCRVSGVSA